ncbi:acetylornithine/succinylornithine family transaminase [Synechococcales cyanobacterium C]|uniref:Acetylornithine aminotransferase n=1 Tax=Petrachloros mirabilis ULC683 TaxID=2781853 RepID=A0A8K2A8M4_9CYAN|nr:aspartate aminotransferase family protein [Petrachloros mirabilis]NCJ07255.1 acetylornithine/succinylornithine family transaminase [Petrachloros mirabilis ULC683]
MPTYGRFPLALVRGEGCRVWDAEGREYLDFVAGIATCTLGHAHPKLIQTVTQQIQTLHHVSNLYYIPAQGQLAQWLTQHSCADQVFFCNSGAEANEGAIKLARKYAHTVRQIQNPIIVTAQASFHGRTLATVTATGQPKYQRHFDPLVPGFHYVPFNDFEGLEAAIAHLNHPDPQVAAILLEPLQGEGGVKPGDSTYFQKVRALCDRLGILLILDEVQVGVGRTGTLWGYEQLGIEPDIFTSAKGLAGGIPIGAVLSKAFCSIFQPGDHASTFGGNPLACAAALTVCQTLETENLIFQAQQRGHQLRSGLQNLQQKYPDLIADVRGWGLINGLELKANCSLTAIDIVKGAMEVGLLLVPAGSKVVRLVPPLVVTASDIDWALQRLAQTFTQLVGETCAS